jgi:hypothetical protein
MAFDDRLTSLLLGLVIGFVLGYFVRLMREIKKELDEVEKVVKDLGDHDNDQNGKHKREETGFMRYPMVANVAILLVVGLTAYAAFLSQKAVNDSQDAVTCNRQTLAEVIESLNERSTYSTDMAKANIELQRSQSDFFAVLLHKPPYSDARRSRAVRKYYEDLQTFLSLAEKNQGKLSNNPYPTIDDFSGCLDN